MQRRLVCFYLISIASLSLYAAPLSAEIRVSPAHVVLDRPEASQQLLVTELADQTTRDRTRDVAFAVRNPEIVSVNERGVVFPLREGRTVIDVQHGTNTQSISVDVHGLAAPPAVSFEHEVIPILTKSRCNSGGCHGKAEGKAGFKLSVFGFDPRADYEAITAEGRTRRLFQPAPAGSLLLRKASAEMPHGGGRKIPKGSLGYRRLLRWVAEGAPFEGQSAQVASIELEPREAVLTAGQQHQIRVTAIDSAGNRRCVTAEAEYESNAPLIAEPDRLGLIQAGQIPGEAAILVRYMGQVAVCRITSPQPGVEFTRPPAENFIDELVWDKLERLGIQPSDLCDDATFLRRVYLDTIGMLPTVDEARQFLEDSAPDKRAKLIDRLLARPEYADYWAMKWSDLLRVDRDKIKPQGAVAVTRWLRSQILQNRPYDELVRDIITAQGDTYAEGPASFYTVLDDPEKLSRSISQLFLGVRIECAQCHHHPFEKWGQDDYFALAGFFTGVKKKSLPGGNQAVFSRGGADLKHPRTGKPVPARPLGGTATDFSKIVDRRRLLADWMSHPENPFFARAIANRLWAHYFGRGLVEPVDDLRATNPATNEPLLSKLEGHLRDGRYDLKAFTRTLLNSRVYQLSFQTNAGNQHDAQNFSHARPKALPAEVLLDAICQATAVPEKFPGLPSGVRAVQVWDNRQTSYFFTIFGRPVRASVCECERSNEPSIAQALHLMNSPEILSKIQSRTGRAGILAGADAEPRKVIEELTLATLSRYPTGQEYELLLQRFEQNDRRAAAEDVLWILLNSKEFIYNR